MSTATSIFGLIGDHQKAVETDDKKLQDKTILQLSNNKVKVEKKPKKATTKKVKKDGNNSKQHKRK